jgi:phage repressor protein C with HTH and peptisase S24 domain
MNFDEDWLNKRVIADPESLFLTVVDGDNMSPTLNPGDLVMIDVSALEEDFIDGVWVFKLENTVHIKRVQQLGPGRFQAKGDNPAYSAITLKEMPRLIGKVVWSDRRW